MSDLSCGLETLSCGTWDLVPGLGVQSLATGPLVGTGKFQPQVFLIPYPVAVTSLATTPCLQLSLYGDISRFGLDLSFLFFSLGILLSFWYHWLALSC